MIFTYTKTSTQQAALRVDRPSGRFLLKNVGQYTTVLLKRSAPGWGGTPSEEVLSKDEVR